MVRLRLGVVWGVSLSLLGAAAPVQDRPPPRGPVYLVVTGLRVDETGEVPAVDARVGEAAVVTLTPHGGAAQRKTAVPLRHRGMTYHTADFAVAFDTSYALTLTFKGGPTVTVADYRVAAEWTHVPIFTFNSTVGTTSPAAVLRREPVPGSDLGCYLYALWPYASYRALGCEQLPPPP